MLDRIYREIQEVNYSIEKSPKTAEYTLALEKNKKKYMYLANITLK